MTFNSYQRENSIDQRWKFQGQEHIDDLGLNWDSFQWRNHQPDIGRFFNIDPLAEKYYYNSPYAFSENKVVAHRELEGLESVWVFDQEERPADNGTPGTSYTADIYVENGDGTVSGPYSGSTYPNSTSTSDNSTPYNTINEGQHNYSTTFGHKGGEKPGLNLGQGDVNEQSERKVPGTKPDGTATKVTNGNFHEGYSDNGGPQSRGSKGCLTTKPGDDTKKFFSHFKDGAKKGSANRGVVSLFRGNSSKSQAAKTEIEIRQQEEFKENTKPLVAQDATNVEIRRRY